MQIVGRKFSHSEFKDYLDGLSAIHWAKFITVHNTSEPDIALYHKWTQKPGWQPEQWLKNLVSYYASMGWRGTPHLFIPPVKDQILVLNDLRVPGVHTPSWNAFSIGVETVGEFEREPFGDPTRANLVFALARLHEKLELKPLPYVTGETGLHFHKEDRRTTHTSCPGRHMVKSDLVSAVLAEMGTPVTSFPQHQEYDAHIHVPVAAQEADTVGMSIQELTSVKWLQVMLNRWVGNQAPHPFQLLSVDGVRGNNTVEAVRIYQHAVGLKEDGIAGPVTRASLKKEVGT